jgi:hypothetical protein
MALTKIRNTVGAATIVTGLAGAVSAGCNVAMDFDDARENNAYSIGANPGQLDTLTKRYYRNNSSCSGLAELFKRKIPGIERIDSFSGEAIYSQPSSTGMVAWTVKEASAQDHATAKAKNARCDKGYRYTGSTERGTVLTGVCNTRKSPDPVPFPFK